MIEKIQTVVIHVNELDLETVVFECKAMGWTVINLSITGVSILEKSKIDYAIIDYQPNDETLIKLQNMNCKTIRMGQMISTAIYDVPTISHDLSAEAKFAFKHFQERNFKSYAYFGSGSLGNFKELCYKFIELAEHTNCHASVLRSKTRKGGKHVLHLCFDNRKAEFEAWLADLPKPVAILASSDGESGVLSEICNQLNISIPETVAIIGRGNELNWCMTGHIGLSTIEIDYEARAKKAVQLLLKMVDKRKAISKDIRIPPKKIILRESTDTIATSEGELVKAIRFMMKNYQKMITVDSIVKHTSVSRRTLERLFASELNTTINEKLNQLRIKLCCEQLVNTKKTIIKISKSCGFSSSVYLQQIFLKKRGITPGAYRKKYQIK